MQVTHLEGRSVADTQGMVAVSGRRPATIRLVCRDLRELGGYDVDACAALLAEKPGEVVLVTATEATQYLGIRAGTVRQWASRERLVQRGHNDRGHPLYDAADLARLAGLGG